MGASVKRILAAAALSAAAAAPHRADEIARGYRGVYRDRSGAVRLELAKSKARLDAGGKTFDAEFKRAEVAQVYDLLLKGRAFVYLVKSPPGGDVFELYWVTPDASTRREGGGLVAYRAQVVRARVRRDQPTDVAALKVVFSTDGMVMLDTATRRWQVGWGREAAEYDLRLDAGAGPPP